MIYYPELLKYAKCHFDDSTAEDLTQQSFVELLRFRGKIHHVRSFLYKALTDLMSAEHRRTTTHARHQEHIKEQQTRVNSTPYDIASHLDRMRQIRHSIRKMKPYLREAATDVLLEGYNLDETAERRGLSREKVKWAVHTARKRIRKVIELEVQ